MKAYEKTLFREFPDLAYLIDYIWTPGSAEPWSRIIAIVDKIDNGNHPTVNQWLGDNEPQTVINLDRGVSWDYSPLTHMHKDTPLLYPEDIDFGVKDYYGNWLLIASRERRRVATTVGALLMPEIQNIVRGIFADDLLPKIMGSMATVKIEYDVPSVEEEKIKFLANAKVMEDKIKYKAEISTLQEQLETIKRDTQKKIRSSVWAFARAKEQGWDITIDDEIIFEYNDIINMECFIYQGKVYDVPDELKGRWYTDHIKVVIDNWGSVKISAWGNHPNIGAGGSVCLGDMVITLDNLNDITLLPLHLQIGNLDSPLNKRVFSEIVRQVIKGDTKENVKKKGFIITI